jgi:hypothetical protein
MDNSRPMHRNQLASIYNRRIFRAQFAKRERIRLSIEKRAQRVDHTLQWKL